MDRVRECYGKYGMRELFFDLCDRKTKLEAGDRTETKRSSPIEDILVAGHSRNGVEIHRYSIGSDSWASVGAIGNCHYARVHCMQNNMCIILVSASNKKELKASQINILSDMTKCKYIKHRFFHRAIISIRKQCK